MATYRTKIGTRKGQYMDFRSGAELNLETGAKLLVAGVDKTSALSATVANAVASTAASKKVVGGAYTVIAGDDTANTKTIATGVTIAAKIVQILRAGADVTGDAAISSSAANLTIADGSTYVLTTGDVINWIVFGT